MRVHRAQNKSSRTKITSHGQQMNAGNYIYIILKLTNELKGDEANGRIRIDEGFYNFQLRSNC